jgi:hypothetical protein
VRSVQSAARDSGEASEPHGSRFRGLPRKVGAVREPKRAFAPVDSWLASAA